MKSIKNRLTDYVKAGYSGIFIVSHEEQRVEAEIAAVCKETEFQMYVWSITKGLMGPMASGQKNIPTLNQADGQPADYVGVLRILASEAIPERSIVVARDYHFFTGEPNPIIAREMKDCLAVCRQSNKRLIVVGCQFKMIPEIEKEFVTVEFGLPSREELKEVLDGTVEGAQGSGKDIHLNGNTEQILDAASGMTTTEAADAFALAVIESKGQDILPEVVAREKCNVVRKQGLLEIIESKTTLADMKNAVSFLKHDDCVQ